MTLPPRWRRNPTETQPEARLPAELFTRLPADVAESFVAVIGRPNVGKSSLVNAFIGAERVIVSEQAGTTRDAIDTELEFDGRRFVLSTPPGCAAAPRSPGRSTTTPSFAPSGRPSAPTSRSSSATRPRASPPRTCGWPSWR